MYRFLESDLAEAGGITVTAGAFILPLLDWLSHLEINDFFQGLMAAGGFVFLCFKIANARKDLKLKRLDEKLKQRELDNEDSNTCH
jgi:hypothetical protein